MPLRDGVFANQHLVRLTTRALSEPLNARDELADSSNIPFTYENAIILTDESMHVTCLGCLDHRRTH